jgi:DNA-binding SARP family transcriptional activator
VDFLVLGPLEVRDGRRRVPTGGPQAEKVLAALLLARGRAVALDALVDALWDGEPPPTANHQVHKLIGGLRRRLPGLIHTRGRAYLLPPGTYPVDAERFADLSARERIPELVAALCLWRGPALAGMHSRALRTAAAALDERRLAVLERLTELRLAAGQAVPVPAPDLGGRSPVAVRSPSGIVKAEAPPGAA